MNLGSAASMSPRRDHANPTWERRLRPLNGDRNYRKTEANADVDYDPAVGA